MFVRLKSITKIMLQRIKLMNKDDPIFEILKAWSSMAKLSEIAAILGFNKTVQIERWLKSKKVPSFRRKQIVKAYANFLSEKGCEE